VFNRILITSATALSLWGPAFFTTARAADADDRSVGLDLEEITVTARRVEERLQEVPIAVTALPGAEIERLNIREAADLQNQVPNLYIRGDSLGGTLQPSFILRGQVQTLTTDENVALYVADVPQSTRGISNALYDIGQVQVLKGPQGTLFGKNSNSGAVVITPNRPTNELGGWLQLQGGNFGLYEPTGVLNLPVVSDKLSIRIAGDLTRQRGTVTNTLPGYSDWDNQKHESARVSILFTPVTGVENLLVADYLHRNEIPSPSILVGLGTSALGFVSQQVLPQQQALGDLARPGPTGIGGRAQDGGYSVTGQSAQVWGLSNATRFDLNDHIIVKNIFGFRRDKAQSSLDLSGEQGYPIFLGGPTPAYVAINNPYTIHDQSSASDELQFIGRFFNNRLNFISGGFWSHIVDAEREWSDVQIGQSIPGRPTIDDDTLYYHSRALFAEGTFDFSDWLPGVKFTSGARYTWDQRGLLDRYFVRSLTTAGAPDAFPPSTRWPAGDCAILIPGTSLPVAGGNLTTCQFPNSVGFTGFSWNQTLAWQANEHTNFYASYKKGYKSGGLNLFLRSDPMKQVYAPETLKVVELGAKLDGKVGAARWFANAALFSGKYKNLQTQALPDFSADYGLPPQSQVDLLIINDVKARMKGAELETGLHIADVNITAHYSYLNQFYTSGSLPLDGAQLRAGTGTPLTGTPYPGAPRQTAGADLTYLYSWLPRSWGEISTTAALDWHDVAPGGVPIASVGMVPAYKNLDLTAAWNNMFGSTLDLGFWMKNVANDIYRTSCFDNRVTLGYYSCQFARQRTYGLFVKYRFGSEVH
jgi:iron complex outermembrane receptor protein